jgi:hypothetical protein
VVVLTAVPSTGYQFEKWSGDIDANTADNISISIVMDRARTITADFVAPGGLHTITVNASPSLGGSATIETPFESFTTSANQTSVSVQCAAGTTVNITAEAAEGYHFVGWKGGVTGSQGNMSFVVNSSEAITANFSKPSSLLWCWVVVGIVVFLLIGLLIYRFKSGMAKKPEDIQPQPNVEQGIVTARGEGK